VCVACKCLEFGKPCLTLILAFPSVFPVFLSLLSLPFSFGLFYHSSRHSAMTRNTDYWKEPATCSCPTCVTENPNGQIVTRLDRKLHFRQQNRNAPAIQHCDTSRGPASHGNFSQTSRISVRGRSGGTRPVKAVRNSPHQDIHSQPSNDLALMDRHVQFDQELPNQVRVTLLLLLGLNAYYTTAYNQ
jgi:hypothetical protein